MPKPNDPPLVPNPADAVISPVGFSSIEKFKIFVFCLLPSTTELSTFFKKI